MAFGPEFVYMEPIERKQLENGDYTVSIREINPGKWPSGDIYLEVVVDIKDHPGCYPDRIQLNDFPRNGDEKQQKAWQNRMSRFFDSFGFSQKEMNFKNVPSWIGKVGTVHCDWQYDKNEPDHKSKKFKQLTAFKPKAETPQAVEILAQEMGGTFQEDIPFEQPQDQKVVF